jgi:hypothetical protein
MQQWIQNPSTGLPLRSHRAFKLATAPANTCADAPVPSMDATLPFSWL